ncbi:hypothetical protein F1654_07430 [Alkalicaulis satelles]|uniref:Uncharacterized protein n=1 Tax=Alkalicaulis satelles TaxID=2609175 RepID=A0A5M6ZHQ8_9PROT|nr:hypothetical protein [Alkalicaulis satelles]KAA5803625.1 hypothetical protein F1654_07430 [Alkalicaulis satelles]
MLSKVILPHLNTTICFAKITRKVFLMNRAPQCESIQRNIRHFAAELNELGRERLRLREEVMRIEGDLRDLGIGISELEALAQLPDTGSALEEALRRRQVNAALNRLQAALIRVRRNPGVIVDLTIATIRAIAQRELQPLYRLKADRVRDLTQRRDRLNWISYRVQELNGLMAQSAEIQRQLECGATGR